MVSKRDAALMPDAEKNVPSSRPRAASSSSGSSLLSIVQCSSSIITRLGIYLFLRWVPSSLAWPAIPIAFAVYALCWLIKQPASSSSRAANELQQLANGVDVQGEKMGKSVGNKHNAEDNSARGASWFSAARSLISGISHPHSPRINTLSLLLLHALPFLLFLDSYSSPYLFPSHYAHSLLFNRVASISPTSAKIHVRWPEPIPLFEGLAEDVPGSGVLRDGMTRVERPFRVVYREVVGPSGMGGVNRWERGPLVEVKEENDWTATVTLGNLWPATQYEYRLAWAHNNTFVDPQRLVDFESDWTQALSLRSPSPSAWLGASPPQFVGGTLRTWPDPRAGRGMGGLVVASSLDEDQDEEDVYGDRVPVDDPNHFKFLTSSCVKPDFPYRVDSFPLWSWALRLLPSPPWSTGETDSWGKRNVIRGFDLMWERYLKDKAQSNVRFLLQLGDLIYADVPRLPSSPSLETYRTLYRNLFASPSFRRVMRHIPMIGIYDDHEIKNNWAGRTGEGGELPEFAEEGAGGGKAWREYVGGGNPESVGGEGENWYTFRYGAEA